MVMKSEAKEKLRKSLKAVRWDDQSIDLGIRFDFRCHYCGKDLLDTVESFKSWEKDHVVPLNSGGKDTDHNLVLACRLCNTHAKNRWNPKASIIKSNEGNYQIGQEEIIEEAKIFIVSKKRKFQDEIDKIKNAVNEFRNS